MNDLDSILVPLELEESAAPLLEAAALLGRRLEGTVTLLHVWQPPLILNPDELLLTSDGEGPPVSFADLARGAARGRLEGWAAALRRQGAPRVEVLVRSGDPVQEILAAAEALQVGLLLLGTHDRSRLARLWYGSVAERVLRRAPCPVMMVHLGSPQELSKEVPPTAPSP
jgi:nucleotide-binding universal stress UspA family protein